MRVGRATQEGHYKPVKPVRDTDFKRLLDAAFEVQKIPVDESQSENVSQGVRGIERLRGHAYFFGDSFSDPQSDTAPFLGDSRLPQEVPVRQGRVCLHVLESPTPNRKMPGQHDQYCTKYHDAGSEPAAPHSDTRQVNHEFPLHRCILARNPGSVNVILDT